MTEHWFWSLITAHGSEALTYFVATLFGAWAGAYIAFLYARKKDKYDETNQRGDAVRGAQVALFARLNELDVLKENYLDEFRDHSDRWAQLLPLQSNATVPELQLGELRFVLSGSDPDTLFNLYVTNSQFCHVLSVISQRNLTHESFQVLREKKEESPRTTADLVHLTDALYEDLDAAISSLEATIQRLEATAKKDIPKVKLLGFSRYKNRLRNTC